MHKEKQKLVYDGKHNHEHADRKKFKKWSYNIDVVFIVFML